MKPRQAHHIIYVPGLGDGLLEPAPVINWWRLKGYRIHIYRMHWNDGKPFDPKLDGLLSLIDQLHAASHIVSLIGFSAGGSAVLNALLNRPEAVHRAVSICGLIRKGEEVEPELKLVAPTSPALLESIDQFNRSAVRNPAALSKALTMRPLSDRVVPPSTVPIEGAVNVQLPCRGHLTTCLLALTLYSSQIFRFISSK